MNNLKNYITERIIIAERIRIDNIKSIDFTKPNKFEGKFKLIYQLYLNHPKHTVTNDENDWYYYADDDKLIFYSPGNINKIFYITIFGNEGSGGSKSIDHWWIINCDAYRIKLGGSISWQSKIDWKKMSDHITILEKSTDIDNIVDLWKQSL